MLHHRRQRDREWRRDLSYRHSVLSREAIEDCPARRVRERRESPV
jgi:hypothetical protein